MSEKVFDCVRMKWEIQQKLMRQDAGMSVDERNRHTEEVALTDPIIGSWFRRVKAAQCPPLTVAENPPPYRAGKTTDSSGL